MDFSTWVTRLSNFFTVFYGFAFAMESLCTSLCVVFCHGHLHLDKRGILKKILYVVILFLLSNVLCMLAYSLFSEFAATAIIFALLLPGAVFLIIKDHGGVFQRIIKMTLFFSSTYVVTEIGHRVNIMVSVISNSFSRELLMSLPYLILNLKRIPGRIFQHQPVQGHSPFLFHPQYLSIYRHPSYHLPSKQLPDGGRRTIDVLVPDIGPSCPSCHRSWYLYHAL